MYSILLSKIEALRLLKNSHQDIIKKNSKVAILPWTFPTELNSDKLTNDFFAKNSKRYKKYLKQLENLGIEEKNIHVCNCYSEIIDELKNIVENSDVLLLPGGNPEMLMSKILHKTELLYVIKHYNGIIIGESAGCLVQFERYFITKENNFYDYQAFYDGIGVLKDPFYVDVHTIDSKEYIDRLKK